MSIRSKELMKGMLQTSCGKVEHGESSWEVVIKETKEETGLEI
jgi:8-oxo-dGTP pyrophosphatase MutT (NUDIX family)